MIEVLVFLVVILNQAYLFWTSAKAGSVKLVREVGRISKDVELLEAKIESIRDSVNIVRSGYGNAQNQIKRLESIIDEMRLEKEDQKEDLNAMLMRMLMAQMVGGQKGEEEEVKEEKLSGSRIRKLTLGEENGSW